MAELTTKTFVKPALARLMEDITGEPVEVVADYDFDTADIRYIGRSKSGYKMTFTLSLPNG